MKHVAINLTIYIYYLYVEKLKIDERNQRSKEREIFFWGGGGRNGLLNIAKMSIISNLSYKFNKIHAKTRKSYFVNFKKLTLQFM